jgi:hypothetical protein
LSRKSVFAIDIIYVEKAFAKVEELGTIKVYADTRTKSLKFNVFRNNNNNAYYENS